MTERFLRPEVTIRPAAHGLRLSYERGISARFPLHDRHLVARHFHLHVQSQRRDVEDGVAVLDIHHLPFHAHEHAAVYAGHIAHANVGLVEDGLLDVVEEEANGFNFPGGDAGGFALVAYKVEHAGGGQHRPADIVVDLYKDVPPEGGHFQYFVPVAPPAPHFVNGTIDHNAFEGEGFGDLFLHVRAAVHRVPMRRGGNRHGW